MRLMLICLLLPLALGACSATHAASAGSDDVAAADAVDDAEPADVAPADAASDVPAAVDVAADVSPLGPATWTGIYTDYFGSTGLASCGGSGCHLAGQGGDIASKFICPDKDTCYTSLTGASKLVLSTDAASPTKSKLMRNLRQVGNAGKMPSGGSTFVFSTADVARISTWISNGAKND